MEPTSKLRVESPGLPVPPEHDPSGLTVLARPLHAGAVRGSMTGVQACPGIVRSLSLSRSRRDRLRKPCETPPTTSGSFLCQNVMVRNGGLQSRCSSMPPKIADPCCLRGWELSEPWKRMSQGHSIPRAKVQAKVQVKAI